MSKKLFYIIQICIVLVAASGFCGCNDTIETGTDDRVRGVSVIPNPMTVGMPVSIAGPGFKDATAIVFPGGVAVTDFTRAGDFQLNAVVPAGAASEGNITVSLPGGDYMIPFGVTVVSTQNITALTREINETTGDYMAGPNDKVSITGTGLGAIVEIVVPGGVSFKSMDFAKKTETSIDINLPMGGFDITAVEAIKLIDRNGTEYYTTNKVDFSGEGFIEPGLILLAGRTYKTWTWDETVERPWGGGTWGTSTGPEWWMLNLDEMAVQVGVNDAKGATMKFELPDKMIKTLADGTVIEGTFEVVMTPMEGSTYVGKLVITGGDDALTILGGAYGGNEGTKEFPITSTDGKIMTLALRHSNGDGYFMMFRAIDGYVGEE